MDAIDEYNALVDGVIERLESLRDAGVEYVPRAAAEGADRPLAHDVGKALLFVVRDMTIDAGSEADKTLNLMLSAMGFCRENVCVFDIIKNGPAGDDNNSGLDDEIARVSPRIIVLLGPKAAAALLGSQDVARLRGRFHDYKGIKVMPSYEPVSIKERTDLRKETWADMQMVMKELEEREDKD